ncbi:hypothetical protein CVD25_20350 [Bacillus canaveralius]|uniref:Lipoprotein n=1 Tax=Bacillus canaveralius TaxID=1403243 RepID=A0A2N5GJP7_9BACI|nr:MULTISPECIES: hypothetical protein [Bacillus]PLR81421.1 hypothetical protein CU635_15175 [Bacillus canaveralius]PLR85752.1 hypothetical protein CVD23_07905 [Bacillus sp. V33-4]PLR90040.1 hypothetical protein CVD25_20350 [Bacillus canaveralius]
MKQLKKGLAFAALLILLLGGCGTQEEQANDAGTDPGSKREEENNQEAGNSEPSEEETNNESSSPENANAIIRILEQNLEYEVNGQEKQDTAFLKHNDNQNYSIYVLPGYELTAEEPHKDSLFLTENPEVFMRIELLPDDTDWESVTENTKAQLATVNEHIETMQPSEDTFLKNATVMESAHDGEIVSAYLIKDEKQPLKLTMFTKENADHRDAFLKMAKTIMKESNQ